MKCAVVYASLTGNTKQIAETIYEELPQGSRIYSVDDQVLKNEEYDVYIIGYWADRGTADGKTRSFLEGLSDKKIVLFGTLGAYPHSKHGLECQLRVWELAAEKNEVWGTYICQGRLDPKLIERFKKLPEGHPHGMDEARSKRHKEAANHPDELDRVNAKEFIRKIIYQHLS